MQINKPNNRSTRRGSREAASAKRAADSRRAPVNGSYRKSAEATPKTEGPKPVSKEDALIDLYEDPFKRTREEEEMIINIDFSKPIEILGKIYRQIISLLRVAQSHATKENALKAKAFVTRDRKTMIITGSIVGVMVLLVVGKFTFLGGSSSGGQTAVQGETTQESIELNATTDFEIIIPNFRTKEQLSIAKVSPPGAPAAYAYLDVIGDDEVQVTQQELPEVFKTNQEKEFEEFALGFAADQRIDGEGFTAYVGTSERGPQSVVAIKNERLVLIKSTKVIDNQLWSQYMVSLE